MKTTRKVVVNGVTFAYCDMLNDHCHPEAAILLALYLAIQAGIDLTGQECQIEEFDFNGVAIHLKIDGKDYWLKAQRVETTEEELFAEF